MTRVSLSILILFLLVLGIVSTIGGSPRATVPAKTSQAVVSRLPILGIDCGLGAKEALMNGTGYPVAPSENGAYETRSSCTWIGDVGNYTGPADKTTEPLVSDQDETLSAVSPKIGGGFTADIVYLQNDTSRLNGFDVTVSWNPTILHAVMIDQTGTNWAAISHFTVAQTINNTAGQAHLLQVVFANYGLNFTFFRIRFDVVGIGNTGLTITEGSQGGILNPGPVVHQIIQGSFDSESYFDPTRKLGWSGGFTVTPNPLVPGSATTFTSTIVCPGCTGSLHYQWDFNNDGVTDSTTNPATITIPTPTLFASRVTLNVADSATPLTHNATIIEGLPFTAIIHGAPSLPVDTAAAWNSIWLGGIAPYSISWRFCPGSILSTIVCSKPAPSISSQTGQNNTQTLSGSSPGYHFSGVYKVSLRVSDSGSGSVSPSTVLGFVPVNVTGGTPVFTVQVTQQNTPVGSPVTVSTGVAYSATYPSTAAFRSAIFKYTLYWGDGASSIITNAGLTTTASHTYSSPATYHVTVVAQDQQTVSQIQEAGFGTVNVPTASGFDYSLSLLPSQGSIASGGGTTSSLVIVNTLTGTPQAVSLKALSPSPGITVSFNATTGLPPYASSATVTVSSSTTAGIYSIVVQGNTTAGIAHQTLFHLTVGSVSIPLVGVFSKQYGSANITDSSLSVGSRFSVQVNVTNALPFNGYEFALYFDQNYISLYSYDFSTGTVFDNPYKSPSTYNNTGALRLAIVNLATSTNNHGLFSGGSGTLANLVFSVVNIGVSPLTLAAGMSNPSASAAPPGGLCQGCPAGSPNWTRLIDGSNRLGYEVQTADGYFKNVAGKSGPVALFTISPSSPFEGGIVTFNATGSFDPDNQGAQYRGITTYLWDFGDVSPQANATTYYPFVTHSFTSGGNMFIGNFSVRLTVIDADNGFQGMRTILLTVTPRTIRDIGITGFSLSNTQPVQGQTILITVDVTNFGNTAETYTLTITYGMQNVTIVDLPGEKVQPGSIDHLAFNFDTTNVVPGSYIVVATASDPFDTNPSNNVAVSQFQVQVHPGPPHDVALTLIQSPDRAISGTPVFFGVTVANTGSNSSTVDVSVFYDGKLAAASKGLVIGVSQYRFFIIGPWDTTGVVAGNYTISATVFLSGDPTPNDNSLTYGRITILPPPVLTLVPSSGPVGTLVVVHGSGFVNPFSRYYPQVELEMTFDNQLLGFFFPQNSSFDFSFDVPDAQMGVHLVHAVEVYPVNLDVQVVFTVTPTPAAISVSISVGTIYFPGDTATIFVMTGLNGQAYSVGSLQVTLIRPNGTSLTLTTLLTATGVYKASYTIPATGSIGTYAVTARAHLTGSGDGTALGSFEVKPSWLTSNGRNIATGAAITGLVGVAALAWRRGYFRKNDEEEAAS